MEGSFVAKGRALSAVHEYPRVSERCYHTHLVNERIFNYISPTYSLKLIMRDRAPNQHTVLRLVGASCWEGAFSLILGLLVRSEVH